MSLQRTASLTFKQLEALYWVAELGGFAAAARQLHTTQPAISKRIHELEAALDLALLDRSARAARLTSKGEQAVAQARQLLMLRDETAMLLRGEQTPQRPLRLGITELCAMTWLPALVRSIEHEHPELLIEAQVDQGLNLQQKLAEEQLDVIVAPDTGEASGVVCHRLALVSSSWMCKKGLMGPHPGRPLRLQELAQHRLLMQGERSGMGLLYGNWLTAHRLHPRSFIVSSNMQALVGMTVEGLGISYLPDASMAPLIKAGLIERLEVRPLLPAVPYALMHRRGPSSALLASLVRLARARCDFSHSITLRDSRRPRRSA